MDGKGSKHSNGYLGHLTMSLMSARIASMRKNESVQTISTSIENSLKRSKFADQNNGI